MYRLLVALAATAVIGAMTTTDSANHGYEAETSSDVEAGVLAVVELEQLGGGALALRPQTVDSNDLLPESAVPSRLRRQLQRSPVPPLVTSDFAAADSWSAYSGIDGYVFRSQYADAHFVVHSLVAPAGALGRPPGVGAIEIQATDIVADRAVAIRSFDISGGHGTDAPPGFRAYWYENGVRYIAQAVCSTMDDPTCRSWFATQLGALKIAPTGNLSGARYSEATQRWIEQLHREEAAYSEKPPSDSTITAVEASFSHSEDAGTSGQAAEASFAACPTISGSRPGFTFKPEGCLTVCPACSNTGPGDITGNPFNDTLLITGWVFPVSSLSSGNTHSYAETQVYGAGGSWGPPGDEDDSPNYELPWEDNLCEFRASQGACDHEGQDIRPASFLDEHYPIVAAIGGVRTFTGTTPGGSSSVQIVRGNFEYFYLHGSDMTSDNNINQGERIAKVSDIAVGGTSVHLHFSVEEMTSPNPTVRNPYDSLVPSYQERWYVAKDQWDNNGSVCELNIYWDFDKARKKLENRNSLCGFGNEYRANGRINDDRFHCTPVNWCHAVYFDSKCGSENVAANFFDPNLAKNYVGDGQNNTANKVFAAQYDLYQAGYNLPSNLDCIWGQETKSGVHDFQLCNGLTITSTVTAATWGEMADRNKDSMECEL